MGQPSRLSLAPVGKHSIQLHAGFQMFPFQPTGFISASLFLRSQAREGTLSTILQRSTFVEGLPIDMIHEWERILMCQKKDNKKDSGYVSWLWFYRQKKKTAQMSWEAAESWSSSRVWVVRRKDGLQEKQASCVNVVMTSRPTQRQGTHKMAHQTQT